MMHVDPATGLLTSARYLKSPNSDERPPGMTPELIIVHGISLPPGEFGGRFIDSLFTNRLDGAAHPYFADICELRVSAHALIERDGNIVQYVPFHRRAWHAGVSSYHGRAHCNDFSIGIELEGVDNLGYESQQYVRLTQMVRALVKAYPSLAYERIAGHADIAPDRKTDPGPAFDWARMHRLLRSRPFD